MPQKWPFYASVLRRRPIPPTLIPRVSMRSGVALRVIISCGNWSIFCKTFDRGLSTFWTGFLGGLGRFRRNSNTSEILRCFPARRPVRPRSAVFPVSSGSLVNRRCFLGWTCSTTRAGFKVWLTVGISVMTSEVRLSVARRWFIEFRWVIMVERRRRSDLSGTTFLRSERIVGWKQVGTSETLKSRIKFLIRFRF